MARLQLRNLEKDYGGFKAVHGINLEVADGEFMVLVGPSGCAKSTTLRMIAGLERVTGGEIRIGDSLVNDKAPGERGIAMVFQNYALYPHMKVRKNLSFGLRLKRRPAEEIEQSTQEVATILEIGDYLERLPKQLSGGQAQRVAVGRALIKKPQVFLFDEPLSNLDAKLRASMRVRITDLHKQLKADGLQSTVVYVTHDQTEAMTMGDRICVMKEGRIMQVADPVTLYNHPANAFVAGFIGSPEMNLVDADLSGSQLAIGSQALTLDAAMLDRLGKAVSAGMHGGRAEALTFGIRPQHLAIADETETNALSGRISHVEFMGHEVYLYVTVEGQQMIVVVPASTYDRSKINGDAVRLAPSQAMAHLFNRKTGENVSLALPA
ncbi:ABC transporter ATP-binding protein [Rhizobium sp. SSA_523]|uniref:ABC transporter ATP-binding protein n=1 Tax=Rhizobium sp. SSA_523 TaxID=2952477 RepID=UPI0020912FF2|nr:sn-glycerol-3-phosphate ABC transporter ATP-binding protein UgpC [Rhizobium sp. SSA_523]MCO5731436.1 sn-glycerol-3-phosphate ABC transporter ATP-binding protein UgpC [Rhizobium sp. SSA_523]WKC22042.1 sn-glycerol-3-phosphate ABC transporter ATP-binding protein UgpC [Rhizobium sp. SSA_523]